MDRTEFRCVACGSRTRAKAFSGGEEWWCLDDTGRGCDADGSYPADVLTCFKCGWELTSISPGGQDRQPNGGTVFRAHGNYGSSVWDPMNGAQSRHTVTLEINLCDACLINGYRQVLRVESRTERHESNRMWFPPTVRVDGGDD